VIACCRFDTAQDWPEVLEQLYGLTDRIESPRPGLMFLDVTQGEARQLATTFRIPVGLASSQEAAHLLSFTAQPGEVMADEAAIDAIPIAELEKLEVNSKTDQRLAWLGVETLGDLRRWSKAQLSLYLGADSQMLIRYLHGLYRHDVARYRPREVLRVGHAFDEPVLEPADLEPVIRLLCRQLADQLGDRAASRLNLIAISQGIAFKANRISKELLNRPGPMERLAHLDLQDSGVLGLEVDELRLELSGLHRPSEQGTLWRQREVIRRAITTVEQRFPGSLLRFDEVNPYTPISEFRYRLSRLSSGEEVQRGDRRGAQERPAYRLRWQGHQLHH
jgi:hypothetical protein